MTDKEKAKAYDEAIERAKDFMNGEVHYALKKGENIMCWVFPQLRESDDERIRKALMQNLKERFGTKGNMGEGLDMPDVLAWIDKQGEQKPNYCHHEVDLSGCSEEYRKAYCDGWNNCNQQHEQLKAEQKSWSEEDEELLLKFSQCCDLNKIQVQWLLSLKDRVQPQNRWKPSEEMLEALNDINITGCISYAGQGQELISLYNELKRLREE